MIYQFRKYSYKKELILIRNLEHFPTRAIGATRSVWNNFEHWKERLSIVIAQALI